MNKYSFISNKFKEFMGLLIILGAGVLISIAFFPSSSFAGAVPSENDLNKTIIFASNRYGIPVPLIIAVMRVESDFNIYAVSPEGAVGLMQIMPDTAKLLNLNTDNPLLNIVAGAKYLHYCLKRFDYKPVEALACYNAGPDSIGVIRNKTGIRYIIPSYRQTQLYILRVYGYYEYYSKILK